MWPSYKLDHFKVENVNTTFKIELGWTTCKVVGLYDSDELDTSLCLWTKRYNPKG